jgi:hypothetical protein
VIGPLDPNGTPLTAAELTQLHAALGNPALLPPAPPAGLASRGISPAVYQAYRTDAQFISADGKTAQFYATLTAGDPQSTSAMKPAGRARGRAVPGRFRARRAGADGT